MSRPFLDAPEVKRCEVCGKEYRRPKFASGRRQNRVAWLARRACSTRCGQVIGGRMRSQQAAADRESVVHPPCVICGGDVPFRPGMRRHRWLERQTCGQNECRYRYLAQQCARGSTTKDAARKRRERAAGPRPPSPPKPTPTPAPARRVPFERFPEPAGAHRPWSPIIDVGPSLPRMSFAPTRDGGPRPAALRAALDAHPDLAAALAGALADSWMPFHMTAVGDDNPPSRRKRP